MKTTPLLWIGCLTVLLCGCGSKKTEGAAEQAPPAIGVGVPAAGDSATRFELWLLTHQPDKTAIPTVPPGKIVADIVKSSDLPGLLARVGMPEWQARIQWSWDDMGPIEPEAQQEITKLDDKYTMNSYSACVWPGSGIVGRVGRACVMQSYACYAARNKMDDRALDIAVATQIPNQAAMDTLKNAGAKAVGEYLRNTKYCK